MQYEPKTFSLPEIHGLSKDLLTLHIGLYEGYVKHLNLFYAQLNKLMVAGGKDNEYAYAVSELRRRLGFEWNGMRLHEIYFETLVDGPQVLLADSALYAGLTKQYGGYAKWLDIFRSVVARGPGWAILNYDPITKQFFNAWVADHEIGQLATLPALLVVDYWEHAYLADYKPNERNAYAEAYLNAVNWSTVAKRFDAVI